MLCKGSVALGLNEMGGIMIKAAYSVREARALCADFREVRIATVLTDGDLLESDAGQRHRGALLTLARKVWPRGLIRRLWPNAGLFMLIEARK